MLTIKLFNQNVEIDVFLLIILFNIMFKVLFELKFQAH